MVATAILAVARIEATDIEGTGLRDGARILLGRALLRAFSELGTSCAVCSGPIGWATTTAFTVTWLVADINGGASWGTCESCGSALTAPLHHDAEGDVQ